MNQIDRFSRYSRWPNKPATPLREVYPLLNGLEGVYPRFEEWFFNKVVAGLQFGGRIVLTARRNDRIAGLAILKSSFFEKKICTLVVNNDYRGCGIGSMLLERSIEVLGEDKPLITVPDFRIDTLGPLLAKKGFILTDASFGLYQARRTEYIFNGAPPSDFC